MKKILAVILLLLSIQAIAQQKFPENLVRYNNNLPLIYVDQLGGGYKQVLDSVQRNAVPIAKRARGMAISYLQNGAWVSKRFEGADTSNTNWWNDANWVSLGGDTTKIIYSTGGNNVMGQDLEIDRKSIILKGDFGGTSSISEALFSYGDAGSYINFSISNGRILRSQDGVLTVKSTGVDKDVSLGVGAGINNYENYVEHAYDTFSIRKNQDIGLNIINKTDTTILSVKSNGNLKISSPLFLQNGVAINSFSTDTTDNSDTAVWTTKTVRKWTKANGSSSVQLAIPIDSVIGLQDSLTAKANQSVVDTKWGNTGNAFTYPNAKIGTTAGGGSLRILSGGFEGARLDSSTGCMFIGATSYADVGSNKFRVGNRSVNIAAATSTAIGGGIISSSTPIQIFLENTTTSSTVAGATIGLSSCDGAASASGDNLGNVNYYGSITGINTVLGAKAFVNTTQGWTSANRGVEYIIATNQVSTNTIYNRLRLRDGYMTLGNGINQAPATSTNTIGINGDDVTRIGTERNTVSNTAGKDLIINVGGATSGATDKTGGFLRYVSGTATGLGGSNHQWFVSTPSSTGTTDNVPTLAMKLDSVKNLTVEGEVIGKKVIGEIYDSTDNVTALVTTGYTTLRGFASKFAINTTNTDSTITVTTAGYYMINYSVSFSFSTVNSVVHTSLFINDVEKKSLEMERKISTAGDVGNMGNNSIVYLQANAVLKIKGITDTAGNITRTHENFNVYKLNN